MMPEFKVDFIGIGAYRSATTWLTQCLREHPDIYVPRIKEIDFFAQKKVGDKIVYSNYQKRMPWYKSQFIHCPIGNIKGEYSNSYLSDAEAPTLIKKHFPEVKLIVCLRHPTDRAYSHYWWDTLNFNANQGISFHQFIWEDSLYAQQSLYYQSLSRFYELFDPKQIHIIIFDDIERNDCQVIRRLYRFLGVDSAFIPPSLNQKTNPAARVRFRFLTYIFPLRARLEKYGLGKLIDVLKKKRLYNKIQQLYVRINRQETAYPPIDEKTRIRLNQIFQDDTEKLEALIDRDLSSWA